MSIQPGDARHDFRKTDSLIVSIPPCEMMFSHFHDFTFSAHQSPETMLSPLISPPTPSEIHELVIILGEATPADRLWKSDRKTIDVDLCRLSLMYETRIYPHLAFSRRLRLVVIITPLYLTHRAGRAETAWQRRRALSEARQSAGHDTWNIRGRRNWRTVTRRIHRLQRRLQP